jgi:hypothetical protein
MTNSKFSNYGIFTLLFSGFLFVGVCFFIYILISVFFLDGNIIPRGILPSYGAIFFIIVFSFMLVFMLNSWIHYAFKIKIDEEEKTIAFENIITRQTSLYNFADFDGFIDTYPVTGKGGSYKVLYLIKDKKAEKIITGFYYENIDEMQAAISSIKYLGFRKDFSKVMRRAVFLNKPILED